MVTNEAGIALIKEFEGCVLTAYPDPGTGGKPWTIGIGHTGPEVVPGLKISQAQADAYLSTDLAKFEADVAKYVLVDINANEHAALVSFTCNCGAGNLKTSTLLRKLNAGDRAGADAEFARWNKAAGKVMAGLTRRRAAEAALFSKPVTSPTGPVVDNRIISPAPKVDTEGFVQKLVTTLISALFPKG